MEPQNLGNNVNEDEFVNGQVYIIMVQGGDDDTNPDDMWYEAKYDEDNKNFIVIKRYSNTLWVEIKGIVMIPFDHIAEGYSTL